MCKQNNNEWIYIIIVIIRMISQSLLIWYNHLQEPLYWIKIIYAKVCENKITMNGDIYIYIYIFKKKTTKPITKDYKSRIYSQN